MEEEWLISALKGSCIWVIHTSSKKAHNRSGAVKERYGVLCVGCVGSERNEMRP